MEWKSPPTNANMKEPTLLGSFPSPEWPISDCPSSPFLSSLDPYTSHQSVVVCCPWSPPAGPPFLLPLPFLPFAAISKATKGAGATWDPAPFSYTMCTGALRFHTQVPGFADPSPHPFWPLFRDRACEQVCAEGHLDCAWRRVWEPLSLHRL